MKSRFEDSEIIYNIFENNSQDSDSSSGSSAESNSAPAGGGGSNSAISRLGGGSFKDGKAEVSKMKANPASNSRGKAQNAVSGGAGKGSGNKGASSASGGASGGSANGSSGGVSASGASSASGSANGQQVDKGGKYDAKKALLNKFKFRLQKNSKEEEKAEAEANRCDPCNEFKSGNGLDFGCIDWGKCAFAKPCCKKFPYPCSCFAYMCFGVTFIGGLVSSIVLF